MTDKKIELRDDELDNVTGGAITYTWNGTEGSLGINGNNPYKLLDKEAFLEVYNKMFGKYNDLEIVKELRNQGIIVKP